MSCMPPAMAFGAIAVLTAVMASAQNVPEAAQIRQEVIVVIGSEAALEAQRAEIGLTPRATSLIDMNEIREANVRIDSHTLFGLRAGWIGEQWRAFASNQPTSASV